jgi:hypothetical protein
MGKANPQSNDVKTKTEDGWEIMSGPEVAARFNLETV